MQKGSKWFWLALLVGVTIFLWLAFRPLREAIIRMYQMIRQFF